ncbi:hypothetical protein [Marinoscillum sp. MHG1-6]|uniref:hypothetical protein n=1 Tax=Marinoscillum sp. MHG1-6 TaxID=2959627 RepID=UPI002158920D|nr:hypothetical protein [Marinoscillum sp. MHG1-6]
MNTFYSLTLPLSLLFLSTYCEGWNSLEIINCTDQPATVLTYASEDYLVNNPLDYYNSRDPEVCISFDNADFAHCQSCYFQMWYKTRGIVEVNENTLSFQLQPGDCMTIAYSM